MISDFDFLDFEIPNHKSSFKKIQKWKKIETLLDPPNSKPQKFFKENPEMSHSLNKLFLDVIHRQNLSIGQNVQISIHPHCRKKSSSFQERLEVEEVTVADNQESHLRLD